MKNELNSNADVRKSNQWVPLHEQSDELPSLSPLVNAPTDSAMPISNEEFKSALDSVLTLSTPGPLAIAVSGGPDSMALAFLLKRASEGMSLPLYALIVDHSLRSTSQAEANATARHLDQMGLRTKVLLWEHGLITHRLHHQARKARYALLTNACKRLGCDTLFLAHHRDDQAETVLLRLSKGSGIEGLSAMARERWENDVRLLRPLLSFQKSRLVATCDAAKLPYILDHSNQSPAFARGRLRSVLPLLAQEGLTIENLTAVADQMREAHEALEFYSHQARKAMLKSNSYGVVTIDRSLLCEAPKAIQRRIIKDCLTSIYRHDYPPSYQSLTRLLKLLSNPNYVGRLTLNGSLIKFKGGHITFLREPGVISHRVRVKAGESIIFDQRWRVSLSSQSPHPQYTVAALGNPPHDLIDKLSPTLRKRLPEGYARASLPALFDGEKLLVIPSFESPLHTDYAAAELLSKPL